MIPLLFWVLAESEKREASIRLLAQKYRLLYMASLSKRTARQIARTEWKLWTETVDCGQKLIDALQSFLGQHAFTRKSRILAYLAMADELSILPVLRAYDLPIFIPRTALEGMEFRQLQWIVQKGSTQRQSVSVPGYHNVPGPAADAMPLQLPLNRADLVIVPGLGTNPGGFRLGRGAGYYDRWRKKLKPAFKIALMPDSLRRLDFDACAHDLCLDTIITETGAYRPVKP